MFSCTRSRHRIENSRSRPKAGRLRNPVGNRKPKCMYGDWDEIHLSQDAIFQWNLTQRRLFGVSERDFTGLRFELSFILTGFLPKNRLGFILRVWNRYQKSLRSLQFLLMQFIIHLFCPILSSSINLLMSHEPRGRWQNERIAWCDARRNCKLSDY